MIKRMFTKRSNIVISMILSMMLVFSIVPTCNALNSNQTTGESSGNKPLDFYGYEFDYTNPDAIELYFDKTISGAEVEAEQFTVTLHESPYTEVAVSTISVASGTGYSGCSDTYLDKGTTIILNLADDLDENTNYDVTMLAATIHMGSGNTLGNYYYRNDFEFAFRTPDFDTGDYSNTTPIVTFTESNGDLNHVSYESTITVIFDRPLKSSEVSTFLSSLSSNYEKYVDDDWDTVVQDSSMDSNFNSSAECYTPHCNDEHNTFFFPQVTNTTANCCYDRESDGSYNYSLTLPSFTDVDDHTFTNLGSFSFTTVSSDLPGWLNQTVTATEGTNSGELDVSWSAGTLTPVATDFDVYYSENSGANTDPYTNTYTLYDNPDITGSYSCTLSLSSGTSYFIRIVPKNAAGTVGFSRHATGTAH